MFMSVRMERWFYFLNKLPAAPVASPAALPTESLMDLFLGAVNKFLLVAAE